MKKISSVILVVITGFIMLMPAGIYAADKTTLKTGEFVAFGSYPQKEIVKSADQCGTVGTDYDEGEFDYVVDAGLYSKLTSSDAWVNNEVSIDGVKYRRMKMTDAIRYPDFTVSEPTTVTIGGKVIEVPGTREKYYGYDWKEGDTSYHYFRYEPIRWRVLKQTGDTCLLLSGIVLDTRKYSDSEEDSYENSGLRCWYQNDFYQTAFTENEKTVIQDILSLSEADLKGKTGEEYGLWSSVTGESTRTAAASEYAKAMGCYPTKNHSGVRSGWWLRNSGQDSDSSAKYVSMEGTVESGEKTSNEIGVRPAMEINVADASTSDLIEKTTEEKRGNSQEEPSDSEGLIKLYSEQFCKTYGNKSFYLKAESTNGKPLSYNIWTKDVLTVNKKGKVTIKGVGKETVSIGVEKSEGVSTYADVTIVVRPGKAGIAGTTVGKRKLTVKMAKAVSVTGGTHYCVRYRVSGTDEWQSINTKKQKVTIKGLEKGRKYEVRAYAFKDFGGEIYTGKESGTVTSRKIR